MGQPTHKNSETQIELLKVGDDTTITTAYKELNTLLVEEKEDNPRETSFQTEEYRQMQKKDIVQKRGKRENLAQL